MKITMNLSEDLSVVSRIFSKAYAKENTEMNRSFSGDSSLFSGVSTKENTLVLATMHTYYA